MNKHIKPTALLLALLLCGTVSLTALAEDNSRPIAENMELETYRGVALGGRLSATDPDGDTLSYEITTNPVKGEISLDEDGEFVYTPAEGKRGKDYFGYKAIDSEGNYSQEATVIIRLIKQKSSVTYSDMAGHGSAYAATALAENDVFVGQCLAGDYVFSPDTAVTREEFLAMCMRISGVENLADVSRTGFADDARISAWAKPYVSTALYSGMISGYGNNSVAVFNPDQPITVSEAAVMLDNVLDLTDAASALQEENSSVPVWAAQSAANIQSCGLISSGTSIDSSVLNRGEAAEMLASALNMKK